MLWTSRRNHPRPNFQRPALLWHPQASWVAGRPIPGCEQLPPRVSWLWGTLCGGRSQAGASSWPLLPPGSQRFRHHVPPAAGSAAGHGNRPEDRRLNRRGSQEQHPGVLPLLRRARKREMTQGAGVHGVHAPPTQARSPSWASIVHVRVPCTCSWDRTPRAPHQSVGAQHPSSPCSAVAPTSRTPSELGLVTA